MFTDRSTNYIFILLLILFVLSVNSSLSAQPHADSSFNHQIHSLEKDIGGRIGIMAKDLRTGETLVYKSEEKFPTASVIKVPIMVEYFYQLAEGKVKPTQKMKLNDSNKWGGSGLYQYFYGETEQQLIDAVMMMITISDNTATNLVIDALGKTHEEKLAAVNDRMESLGLKNTRLLNKLMSWDTKTDSPESIRYGIGVTTPADMVMLLEKMYHHNLVDSTASQAMIDLMLKQQYNDLIPRLLPFETTPNLRVAHKGGSVTAVRNDVGLILSPETDIAIAIFCDQIQDRRGSSENDGVMAAARAARIVWNHFSGDRGFDRPAVTGVDWSGFPGGEWARVMLNRGLFPHKARKDGHTYKDTFYPADPHYSDSSAVIIIPDDFHEPDNAVDFIVHFHGWNNDVLKVMEKFNMVQQLVASNKNVILVLAQGPYRSPDSHGGKIEDTDGLKHFIEEIIHILKQENRIEHEIIGKVIISAHSGGYRPAIFSVERGGLQEHIAEVFLFDAFYGETERLIPWLKMDDSHRLRSIYTEHLKNRHMEFIEILQKNGLKYSTNCNLSKQIMLCSTECEHDKVIEGTFLSWLKESCLADRKPE